MYYQKFADSIGGTLSLFSKTPLSVMVNGNVAVVYFFVLTGFLVEKSNYKRKSDITQIVKKSLVRYIRLLPVVLVATVFTYLSMKFGLQYHIRIADEV